MAKTTYKSAGVDIDKADAFIKRIKPMLQKTGRPEVLGKIGGFSGFFKPPLHKMKEPVLVSSTDGVGTKLLIAEKQQKFDTVGIDLVAMCVNDVIVTGAEPLFFLDYIACGKLDNDLLYSLMRGIARGCRDAGCALIGGETAELPGMYTKGKLDLAGFCVGLADRHKLIDGSSCLPGDKIIGLPSSGLHSNGFSLVRKVLSPRDIQGDIGRKLLTPTKIYVKPIMQLIKHIKVKAMAHITGGGFFDNIPRVLPPGLGAFINKGAWPIQPLFRQISKLGQVDEKEMFRTFNMGIGMILIVGSRSAERTQQRLKEFGQRSYLIGEVTASKNGVTLLSS